MALWRLHCHLVWSTKYRAPIIAPSWEADLYGYMVGKAVSLGCIVHAINGTDDHIHVVASIPPTIAIADFVKRLKGSSSRYRNQVTSSRTGRFQWQASHGAFSVSCRQLKWAIAYVENQKQHHAQNQIWPALEPVSD
ncbi:MAG: IS200/IS605 family transposase [Cyanobacteria bacterium J06626_18]